MRALRTWAQALACVLLLAAAGCYSHASAAPASAAPAFSGKFELVPLFKRCEPAKPSVASCPILDNGHSYYALRDKLSLRRADGTVLTAPAGMTTDLASIPRVLWVVLPPDGAYAKAATIHDDCYRTRGTFVWVWPHKAGEPAKTFVGLRGRPPLIRADCDEVLREGMIALRVPAWQRVTIYGAVREFGGPGWGR